jgi:hypothetical protein
LPATNRDCSVLAISSVLECLIFAFGNAFLYSGFDLPSGED